MTTTAHQHHHARQPQQLQQLQIPSQNDFGGIYDPDEDRLCDSPLMKALHPNIRPSPSPPPDIPPAQVSLSPSPTDGPSRPPKLSKLSKSSKSSKSNRRHKIRPSSGDAVLVAYLDNGRHPEIARAAGRQALPLDDEQEDEEDDDDYDDEDEQDPYDQDVGDKRAREAYLRRAVEDPGGSQGPDSITAPAHMTAPNLQHLAAGALQVVAAEPTHEMTASTRQLSIRDDRPVLAAPSAAYHVREPLRSPADLVADSKPSPAVAMLTPGSGELPPLLDSPRSEFNGPNLPSIRTTLGDLNHLPTEPPSQFDTDLSARHGHGSAFPRSPPAAGVPRLHPMAGGHVSPPISPSDAYHRSLPSPRSLPASSPYYYPTNGLHHRPSAEYSSSSATGETPGTDHTASTPATSVSVAERMSIDGLTNPPIGVYVCNYSGCTAPPFQTQYLLNSHANVHSSARPHYCPVQGCPRSEGGKGFKRKNEMIRHGLVHDSPGYVCPFCPDREHKYPRPDNLQRHVRVHHVDKDKDDPQLRDVLAQRPDGPSRGRRRRGVPP